MHSPGVNVLARYPCSALLWILLLLMPGIAIGGESVGSNRFSASGVITESVVSIPVSSLVARPVLANSREFGSDIYLAQLTMSEAIRIAKRRYPGRVLSAKRTIGRNGQVVYRIKILSKNGEIRTLQIPAGGAKRT